MTVRRRAFLIGSLSGVATLAARRARALPAPEAQQLSFYHIHTGEKLRVVYREHGALVDDALAEINRVLRDFRTGDVLPIDPALLDQLYTLDRLFGPPHGHFEVICGYRSAKTNEALRHLTSGVAKDSLHVAGRAIDIRHTATSCDNLRDAAIALQRGGVGYYHDSNFVHVDTGRFRTW
jgi:uncharacterized protein YcbK (DUF882 family)